MRVLLTGAHGTVGTAVTDHLADDSDYEWTLLDREEPPERHESFDHVVADVADYDAVRPAFEGVDAVVHLAGYPKTDATFEQALENNVRGTYNALEAARDAGVERVVFASSNHAVGMYEEEHAPALYEPGYDLTVGADAEIRPDSHYGSSKAAGEAWGRQYVENHGLRFYALRIGSIRDPEYDHPFGDAERGVEAGRWERGSDDYEEQVARMKCTWQSRRDFAHMVDRCLRDESVDFGVFYGVSGNANTWFDVDEAREALGYEPADDGSEWEEPPER